MLKKKRQLRTNCGRLSNNHPRPPPKMFISSSQNLEHVTLHGKKDFVKVILLRTLKWEGYSRLSRWAQCNHRCPYKRKQEGQRKRRAYDNGGRGWSDVARGELSSRVCRRKSVPMTHFELQTSRTV